MCPPEWPKLGWHQGMQPTLPEQLQHLRRTRHISRLCAHRAMCIFRRASSSTSKTPACGRMRTGMRLCVACSPQLKLNKQRNEHDKQRATVRATRERANAHGPVQRHIDVAWMGNTSTASSSPTAPRTSRTNCRVCSLFLCSLHVCTYHFT